MAIVQIPQILLNSGHLIPTIGLGTATHPMPPPEQLTSILVDAIEAGYRHFDTAASYGTEECVGRAVARALDRGLIENRDQVFVTSKLSWKHTHHDLVLPALKETLRKLGLEYVDLYLIHWPIRIKDSADPYQLTGEDMLHFDINETWKAMEECYKLGLAKSIGVSNYSCAKLSKLLENASIPPAVNQVEMNVAWQQQKLLQFCKEKNILVCAWSPLGANGAVWGSHRVMQSPILKEIAAAKNKSVAQVAVRWIYEQGVSPIVKSFNMERMKENLQIFDWKLTEEEVSRIQEIPQARGLTGDRFVFPEGQYKSVEELWDGEIMAIVQIPQILLNSGHLIPTIGLGTSTHPMPPPEQVTSILVDAIEAGYRHFDTAATYGTEECVGRAVARALDRGLIENRDQVFVTSKLSWKHTHHDLVLPALKETLRKLGLEYVDLYLIHMPMRIKDSADPFQLTGEDMLHFDINETWKAMEECYKLGLAKSIGVSNYSCAKLTKLLENATIHPAVNQVEMNVAWQQQKLLQFCKEKNILVCAWSPLGANGAVWGSHRVMQSPILQEIAAAKNKSVAQVAVRWIYEQGVCPIVKSFNKERMKENLQIFDWKLTEEEVSRIQEIPQARGFTGDRFVFPEGQYKSVEELWDGEV